MRAFLSLVMLLAFVVGLSAQVTTPKADITGQWTASFDTQIGVQTYTYEFVLKGNALTGKDEFRWHFGPMFYRGRLGDHEIKVLIVGQEGAQDESLSHRSFTGGTGARMQHLLTHLGITRSYLFANTFVCRDGPVFRYDRIQHFFTIREV